MDWIILIAATSMEVVGTIWAKQANGFTNHTASALMLLCYGLSLGGLTLAMKNLEMSVAYPVWTGLSILIVSILGTTLFRESMSFTKGISIFLLLIGLVGLTMGKSPHT